MSKRVGLDGVIIALICMLCIIPPLAEARTFAVTQGHPRLFVTPDNLAELRQRAATTHADTYDYLRQWCEDNWNSPAGQATQFGGDFKYETGLLRYALIHALGEIPGTNYAHTTSAYGDKAVAVMMDRIAANSINEISYIAIAYDWVNDRLNSQQKQTIVSWFREKCGETPRMLDKPRGYRFPEAPYCFYPGLAFWGDGVDESLANTYLELVETFLEENKAICHASSGGGGHSAGYGYGQYSYGPGYKLGQHYYALLTATSLTLADTFEKYPYMYDYPIWLLYGMQPGPLPSNATSNTVATVTKWDDCGSWLWNVSKNDYNLMHALRIVVNAANERGDTERAGLITWLINERFQAPKQNSVWDLIFNDRVTQSVSPQVSGLPRIEAFGWDEEKGAIADFKPYARGGVGQVYMKSDWDSSDNATHASFKAFPYYYFGHQHFDSLAFSIFKGGPLALPNSGGYFYWYEGIKPDAFVGDTKPDPLGGGVGFPHHFYYYERTHSTNSLLIMDPDERIYSRNDFYQNDQVFRDGGQRSHLDSTSLWGAMDDPLREWGGLIRYEDEGTYTYISADATKGYNSVVDGVEYVNDFGRGEVRPKVSLVQRDFVYLKGDGNDDEYFVVFDRIVSTNPTFRKVFLLHTAGEPELDGTETQIYGGDGGGLSESVNTHSFRVRTDRAQLFMRTLLPKNSKVYKMGGVGTTTTSQFINDTAGTEFQGPRINIPVNSTVGFPDKPIVTINDEECFMCDGKTADELTGCIRGHRYFKYNHQYGDDGAYIPSHPSGSVVKQYYAWMYRESDTGNWISHPYHFGNMHYNDSMAKGVDDYGRWALRVETVEDESLSNFLHVLHPTSNMTKVSLSETVLVEAEGAAGALIKDSKNQWVVLFSETGVSGNSVSYTANYGGNCKHLISGTEPGVYDVYKDGQKLMTVSASRQHTLFFETDGGGAFQAVRAGEIPNENPTAAIQVDKSSGEAPLAVRFQGSGKDPDGFIISYAWDFGDGSSASGSIVDHTYGYEGTYEAALTVVDDLGGQATATKIIEVSGDDGGPTTGTIPDVTLTADNGSGIAPLIVRFSGSATDSDGEVVEYIWSYGDGYPPSRSASADSTRTFQGPGQYIVTLTAVDNDGNQCSASVTILVSGGTNSLPSIVSLSAEPSSGTAPQSVRFSSNASDRDGSIQYYFWCFGDGTSSTGQNVSHLYEAPGRYIATLTVKDSDGGKTCRSTDILLMGGDGAKDVTPPRVPTGVAAAIDALRVLVSADKTSGEAPLGVKFGASCEGGSGSGVSYTWNFGDGVGSGEQNPTHTFSSEGSYTVGVEAVDGQGKRGRGKILVVVSGSGADENVLPEAGLTAEPTQGEPPLQVNFHGSGSDSDGNIVLYEWDFGDGQSATGETTSHTYVSDGAFRVTLTVTDDQGGKGFAHVTVRCGEAGFPYVIDDFQFYPIPAMPLPEKGVPFEEPVFHTQIMKITDAKVDFHGSTYDYAQPGYPKHDIENASGTMLLIQSHSSPGWHIVDAETFDFMKHVPTAILESSDPDCRWDTERGEFLYCHKGPILFRWNVDTEVITEIHDFSKDQVVAGHDITGIGMREEGTPSDDMRYWAFLLRERDPSHQPEYWWSHAVVYDMQTDGIVGVIDEAHPDWPKAGWDSISMSPSGRYAVEGDGLHLYNRDFSGHVDLPGGQSHWDFAYDEEGREVLVDVQEYWYTGFQSLGYWYRMIDLETKEVFWLAPRGGEGQHVSGNCYETPGWIVASLEYPFYPDEPDEWGDHSVYMVELTRIQDADNENHARVWRLAHARSNRQRYSDSPYAKINRRGTKVWFGSGWGHSINEGTPYDTYQIDLPASWYEDLSR